MSAVGIFKAGRLNPGERAGLSLPPGLWALHTLSTVPYVEIEAGGAGRALTWGETIELKKQGQITNVSAHVGDVVLGPVTEKSAPLRPASYSLPALLEGPVTYPGIAVPVRITQWIDTRGILRATLALTPRPALGAPFDALIEQKSERGLAASGQSSAATTGVISYAKLVPGTAPLIALGIGVDDAGQDPRPGPFFDSARLLFDATAGTEGYLVLSFV